MPALARRPVEVQHYSGDSYHLIRILWRHFRDRKRPMTGAEIGVHRGFLSALLLRALPNLKLFMVDTWTTLPPDTKGMQSRNVVSQQQHDRLMGLAIQETEFARDRRVIMRMLSADAARAFVRLPLDWAFVDACHGYYAVVDDMKRYWPVIKPGGIFAGHDYCSAFPGVVQAVTEFVAEHQVELFLKGHCWWFVKPQL